MQALKIAVIGGGSSYTPELIEGIIVRYEQLPVTELALVTNPLVGNVTDAQALLDEVLTINRQWLTQFN